MINTAQDLPEYKKRLKRALENKFLRQAMAAFAAAYPEGRARALTGVDFEALRVEIARGKDAALPHLQELYEAFKAKAEAAGAKVHLAGTAREANEIIAAIAKEGGAKKIVKSKSMTAEETFLNDHLEQEGLEVVETDLGEWIIQLRHEGPSHMVMPAIHLSRDQVAELFTEVTGTHQEADIESLVKVARREMRKHFLSADMGISGANFAIAASGTLGIISNEGNARLTTTLPRVHVAVVVPPHQAVNGTDVGAGAAADAAQDLGKDRVFRQRQAAVVQKDDVQVFEARRRGLALRGPGDPGDIGGDDLAGGVLGQNLENPERTGQVRH